MSEFRNVRIRTHTAPGLTCGALLNPWYDLRAYGARIARGCGARKIPGMVCSCALRARRARIGAPAPCPQIPGRAAENFFLRVHFHKRKKFRGRRFQDKSKICTYSRTLGGKLGAIQHKTTQTEPSFGVKRPHKNKPKCKKSQD